MGVAGCGKTHVGKMLAQELDYQFIDADDFHSQANIEKMRSGVPLEDADREPWLNSLGQRLQQAYQAKEQVVLAASLLKENYREKVLPLDDCLLVHLHGEKHIIAERMRGREHFMPEELLDSQLALLENPSNALVIDVDQSTTSIVEAITAHVNEGKNGT